MYNYRFKVEYLGTPFCGWQKQPHSITVQGEIEKALYVIFKQTIKTLGSGRTDTGVHAAAQVVSFSYPQSIDISKTMHSLNGILGSNIAIYNLEVCELDFHPRYAAKSRTYHYQITTRKSPLNSNTTWHVYYQLDIKAMQSEIKTMLGTHDFNEFSIPRKDGRSTECQIQNAEIITEGNIITIVIQGNRFLHGMMRAIVGHLVLVGRQKISIGSFKQILSKKDQVQKHWAQAHGLTLHQIEYDDF
jgi:tRNA pseudouridine38-40 synthase